MQRRVFLLLGLILASPMLANASVISMQGGPVLDLLPNTAGQQVILLLSGNDTYTDSNMRMSINGGIGPAPAVSALFGDTGGVIPGASMAGSVWAGGNGGIAASPNGTTADSSGLELIAALTTNGFAPSNAPGVYAVLTVTTVGVPAGTYNIDLSQTDMAFSDIFETGETFPVALTFEPMALRIVPEPSSVVLGLFAVAGMVAVVIRRRRAA